MGSLSTATERKMNIGDKVWVKLADIDDECWVMSKVVGFTPKRIKCETLHGIGPRIQNYAPHNVKPRQESINGE